MSGTQHVHGQGYRRLSLCASLGLVLLCAPSHVLAQGQTRETANPVPQNWQNTFNRLALYGDFRSRLEADWNRPTGSDRWRSRLRIRLGANYSVQENLLVGARLSTGAKDNARDTNHTSGGSTSKIEINLDRLFLTWNPEIDQSSFVTLGKFGHAFARNPVYEELVWYSDVQPEGVLLGKTFDDLGALDRLRGQAGYYIYSERDKNDIRIIVAELLASSRVSEATRADMSLAWYGYENPGRHASATVNHYQLLDAIAGVWTHIGGVPWRFSLEGLSNMAASGRDGRGWALGFSVGSAKQRGDWRAYYQYQEIGNDAVFVPVAGADFLIDHNFRGHVGNVDYVLSQDVTLRVRALAAKPLDPALAAGADDTALRLRLELSVKF